MASPPFETIRPYGSSPFGTRNELRAMSWIRAINVIVYNSEPVYPALTEDFMKHFPEFAGWYGLSNLEEIASMKNSLRVLRDRLVEHFDVPADGVPGRTK